MSATVEGPDIRCVAVVLGAARPFGAEIVARLRNDGLRVVAVADGSLEGVTDVEEIGICVVNTPVELRGIAFRDLSEEDFREALEPQLYDLVAAGQWAASRMRSGGCIVHVASKAHLGSWGGAHHMAAGGALVAVGRSMALEFDAAGIRVNTVATDFAGSMDDDPETRRYVAATVAWLAGPDSAAVSGETILANRGRSLRLPPPRRPA